MIQPFILFQRNHLQQLQKLGNSFIVTQTYDRVDHFNDNSKTSLLLSDYKDHGPAQIHFKAIRSDKFAAIVDLKNPKHLEKMEELLDSDKYVLYWGVIQSSNDLKKRLDSSYKTKIRRYLMHNSSWRIAGDDEVKINFEVVFGELFLILKWRTNKLRIKFAEIERL